MLNLSNAIKDFFVLLNFKFSFSYLPFVLLVWILDFDGSIQVLILYTWKVWSHFIKAWVKRFSVPSLLSMS